MLLAGHILPENTENQDESTSYPFGAHEADLSIQLIQKIFLLTEMAARLIDTGGGLPAALATRLGEEQRDNATRWWVESTRLGGRLMAWVSFSFPAGVLETGSSPPARADEQCARLSRYPYRRAGGWSRVGCCIGPHRRVVLASTGDADRRSLNMSLGTKKRGFVKHMTDRPLLDDPAHRCVFGVCGLERIGVRYALGHGMSIECAGAAPLERLESEQMHMSGLGARYHIGVDVGGTFTDFHVLDETSGAVSDRQAAIDPRQSGPGDHRRVAGSSPRGTGSIRRRSGGSPTAPR